MPTKKRRVGFIPRENVFDIIDKLSLQSNLSISKIINILVEEALINRGIYDIHEQDISKDITNRYSENDKNFIIRDIKKDYENNTKKKYEKSNTFNKKEISSYYLDIEIYEKFLLFLEFQEKIKKNK